MIDKTVQEQIREARDRELQDALNEFRDAVLNFERAEERRRRAWDEIFRLFHEEAGTDG